MKNVVIGSFVGFVLAAAFLAACGSGGSPDPVPLTTPSAVKWSALGALESVPTGITLSPGETWSSTATFDNGAAGTRNTLAAFDMAVNADTLSGSEARIDVGVLPTLDGSRFATDPQWIGTIAVATSSNRRGVLVGGRLPPTPFRLALRLQSGASGTVRVTSLDLAPFNEELQ